jgi:YidC/Oxa1 family membrane protein insertase
MEQLGQEDPKSMQRLLLATLLMAAIFGVWSFFVSPKKAEAPPPPQNAENKVSTEGAKAAVEETKDVQQAVVPLPPEAAIAGETEAPVVLENGDLRVEILNKGAVLAHVKLLKYHEKDGPIDDLVSPLASVTGQYPLTIATGDETFDSLVNGALFHVEQSKDAEGQSVVVLTWSNGKGDAVRKTISLPQHGYEIGLDIHATKGGQAVAPVPLTWGPGFGRLLAVQAKNRYYQQEYVGLYEAGAFKKVTRSKVKAEKPEVIDSWGDKGPIQWAAITNNYFAAAFLPDQPMPWTKVVTRILTPEEKKLHPADSDITLLVAFPGKGRLFLGPKEWSRLSAMGDHFYKLTDWGILWPICAFLLWALKKLFDVSHNYGVAILLLTLLIKVAFYPLTQKSMVKMKQMGEGMKKLKPQIDRIKSKYKKLSKDMTTRSKMNEEIMALYQREGINPLGGMSGCLPMLLQMPIFFALFTMLPRAMELRGMPFFGWIQDLSVPDPYYITPLVMGVSMFISTKMTSAQGMEGAQKMMLWFMPVMFTWFCLWAPAGLTLYWLANNVLTMGQQAIINKQVAQAKEEAAKSRKSTPKGPSRPSHA